MKLRRFFDWFFYRPKNSGFPNGFFPVFIIFMILNLLSPLWDKRGVCVECAQKKETRPSRYHKIILISDDGQKWRVWDAGKGGESVDNSESSTEKKLQTGLGVGISTGSVAFRPVEHDKAKSQNDGGTR